MKNFFRISLFMPLFGLAIVLQTYAFADKQSDAEAEQRRLDNERQEQKIYERKLEDQHYNQKQQDQERINRQIEQRRLENARQQRKLTGHELAVRDRERRNDLIDRDDQDLMDDTLDERFLERNTIQWQTQNLENQPPRTAEHPAACPCMTCQDRQIFYQMEEQHKHHEQEYQQRKLTVEQWDRDHSRD